jgi:hypothetical protein
MLRKISVIEVLIKKYGQAAMPTAPQDPNNPQQKVVDSTGKEYLVVSNDPGSPDKVLMPSDQVGKEIPEGLVTVNETELSTNYSVPKDQNPDGTEDPNQDVTTGVQPSEPKMV